LSVPQLAGAFATLAGRSALAGVVAEALTSNRRQWLADGVLDTVERYAQHAFVLDGSDVTCGALPVQ